MKEQNAFDKIYEVVREIPKGQVATYGQVAELAGNRRWARVVGYALRAIPDVAYVPWHRVVTKEGRVYCGADKDGSNLQVELLEAEGVEFVGGKVDMKHFQWNKRLF